MPVSRLGGGMFLNLIHKGNEAMTDNDSEAPKDAGQTDKREQRAMWIFSGAIVLLILAGMGANMLFHHDKGTGTDISSQSRTAPEH
jgi:hypothetical protein